MTHTRFLIIALLFGLSSAAKAEDVSTSTAPSISSSAAQGQIAEWSVIQAAGGIKVGPVDQKKIDSWVVPLQCDLSSSAGGTVIKRTDVQQDGRNIYISLVVAPSVWTLTPQRSLCKPITVTSTAGINPVYYRDAAGKTYLVGYAQLIFDTKNFKEPPRF